MCGGPHRLGPLAVKFACWPFVLIQEAMHQVVPRAMPGAACSTGGLSCRTAVHPGPPYAAATQVTAALLSPSSTTLAARGANVMAAMISLASGVAARGWAGAV